MGKVFKLRQPKKLGDKDPKYGQAWWSDNYDNSTPLKFNLMDGEVYDGMSVEAEEWVNKQSAKGTEYMQLKKVRILGSAPEGAPQVTPQATQQPRQFDRGFATEPPVSKPSGRDDEAIKAQFAIKAAIEFHKGGVLPELTEIQKTAIELYHMVDVVKNSKSLKAAWNQTVADIATQEDRVVTDIPQSDEEMKSLMETIPF